MSALGPHAGFILAAYAAVTVVLGGLTLWLHQDWFIKVKPTVYYLMVSGILWFGLWTGKPTLKLALGTAYPGLTERGWMLLSRNWAIFFIAMAVATELVWRNFSTGAWLGLLAVSRMYCQLLDLAPPTMVCKNMSVLSC